MKANLEVYKKRIKICKDCPSVRNSIGVGLTCGIFLLPDYIPDTCGCKLSWKAKIENHSCPQNKW